MTRLRELVVPPTRPGRWHNGGGTVGSRSLSYGLTQWCSASSWDTRRKALADHLLTFAGRRVVGGPLKFKVFGPLVVEGGGHSVGVPRGRQRALLIALLLRVGTVVPADRLIDDVWAAAPPADPAHALQQTVSQLRRVLRGG